MPTTTSARSSGDDESQTTAADVGSTNCSKSFAASSASGGIRSFASDWADATIAASEDTTANSEEYGDEPGVFRSTRSACHKSLRDAGNAVTAAAAVITETSLFR